MAYSPYLVNPVPAVGNATASGGNLLNDANSLQGLYGANEYNALGTANGQAQQTMAKGQQLANQANGNQGFANQALATGFNSNNGLYNTELGAVNDQTNAGLAARGLSMTPYGASVQSDADLNFNQQWQQQQLQNQQTAAGTASTLQASQANDVTAGEGLANSAAMEPTQALSSLISSGATSAGVMNQATSQFLSYLQTALGAMGSGAGGSSSGGRGGGNIGEISMDGKQTGTFGNAVKNNTGMDAFQEYAPGVVPVNSFS